MIIQRIREHFAQGRWASLLTDVLVVVIGILLAFQIDRWAEVNRNRELERNYLFRLQEDLQMEVQKMNAALEHAHDRIAAAMLLQQVLTEVPERFDPDQSLSWALETATWRSFPQITAFVYRELQSTGNLSLLQSDDLRRNLAEHYQQLQHDAEVALDLDAQHRFDRYTAGILTIDEQVAVENGFWGDDVAGIDKNRAAEIASQFRQRTAAIALLPSLVQHHTFNTRVISAAIARAQALSAQIDSMISVAP